MTARLWLSGGAARGAMQIAPMREIYARHGYDVEIDATSTGGPSALAYATGRIDLAETLYRELDRFQVLRWPWQWPSGLYSLSPLRDALLRHMIGLELRCPVRVHVVDVARRAYGRVLLNDIPLSAQIDAVIATCSQPSIHAPASIRGRRVCDGGAWHPMPYAPHAPGDLIYAVSCAPLTWDLPERQQVALGYQDTIRVLIEGDHTTDYRRLRRIARNASVVLVEPRQDPGPPMNFTERWTEKRIEEIGPEAWAGRVHL